MESFQCPLCCGRIFSSRRALKYHLLSEVTNVSCPKCKHRFENIHDLTKHLDDPCTVDSAAGLVQIDSQMMEGVDTYSVTTPHIVDLKPEFLHTAVSLGNNTPTTVPVANSGNSILVDGTWIDNANTSATHYCSTCNLQIYNIMEHISTYHPNDTIYYEKEDVQEEQEVEVEEGRCGEEAEVVSDCYVSQDTLASNRALEDLVSEEYCVERETSETVKKTIDSNGTQLVLKTSNISTAEGHDYALLNMPTSKSKLAQNKSSGKPMGKGVQKCNINGISTLLEDKTAFSSVKVIKTESDCNQDSSPLPNITNKCKVNFDNGLKLLPKELGLVRKYQMVDSKTGIPYIRKVIQIEKFWEQEAFKTIDSEVLKTIAEKESSKSGSTKKQICASRKKHVDKERTSVVNVGSHLEDLFRSGALISVEHTMRNKGNNQNRKNKKYILKDGVFVEEESNIQHTDASELHEQSEFVEAHSSVTTIENVKVNFNEVVTDSIYGRTSILKFIQDDAGENMIPIYTCSKCTREYSSTRSFTSHKCKRPRMYVSVLCSVCGYKCKNQANLEKHMVIHDPEYIEQLMKKKAAKKNTGVPVMCDICNTQFQTENGLRMHKKMHRPDNLKKVAEMNNKVEFCCDLCNLVCYSERTFRIHCKIHYPDDREIHENASRPFLNQDFGSGMLSCKICLVNFDTNNDLRAHWVTHHASVPQLDQSTAGEITAEETVKATDEVAPLQEEETFTCDVCGKVLLVSVREQHATINCGQYKYTCGTGTCNRHFKSEEELEMHSQCHMAETDFSCGQCPMTFEDAASLRGHVAQHTTRAERPYPCGFCGRRFARPHEKVKHEWIHTGYQPYSCKVCGMRFRVAYCLKTHERIHTGIRPYTCETCGKQFRTCSGHRAHIRIHSDLRSYKCKLCYKTFKTPIQLAGHRKSHTKPYTCTLCSRRFANMFMLRAHTGRHTTHKESLKHKCHLCGASYGREYALKDHIKTHGKNVPQTPKNEAVDFEEEESQQSSTPKNEAVGYEEEVSQQSSASNASNVS